MTLILPLTLWVIPCTLSLAKDPTFTFRDPVALTMMLVTLLALTLAIAFTLGGLTDQGMAAAACLTFRS